MNQPSNDALHRAWTDAIYAEGIPGARAEARQELAALRDARTTWCGPEEMKLRRSIDEYLGTRSSYQPSFGDA